MYTFITSTPGEKPQAHPAEFNLWLIDRKIQYVNLPEMNGCELPWLGIKILPGHGKSHILGKVMIV